jgi:hypothetical protein
MTNRQTKTLEASMKRLTLWTCLLVVAAAGPAWSVPQIMTEFGDQAPWLGTDINAMGGTGAALYRGGMSNIFNPAFLAVETSNRLDAGLSVNQENEDRFQSLFDTFASEVSQVAIASNQHAYWQSGFGLALHDPAAGLPITVALSLADRYPFSYTFEEEVRDPDSQSNPRDSVLENRERKVTGTLRNLSLGMGAGFLDWLSVGAAVHYAFGTRTETRTRRIDYGDMEGLDSSFEQEMNGVNFTAGLRAKISQRIELGFAYESALTANGLWNLQYHEAWSDTANNVTVDESYRDSYYRYPQKFRGGITFYPQTDPRTVFTAELEYVPWQKFEQNLGPKLDQSAAAYLELDHPDLEKVVDVRIGLEHTFYNGVPLRFGFRHYNSYADPDAGSTIFNGGTGFPIGSGLVAVSVELMKITSFQEHQFPYPENPDDPDAIPLFPVDPEARVEDMQFRIGASYTVNW